MKMKYRHYNYNFMKMRGKVIPLSAILLIGSFLAFFVKGPNYGVDFAGGTEMMIAFNENISADQVRGALDKGGFVGANVQSFEGSGLHYLVRLKESSEEVQGLELKVTEALKSGIGASVFKEVERNESIGAVVGKEYRERGFLAIVYSLIGILIYVAVRFPLSSRQGSKTVEGENLASLGIKVVGYSRWGIGGVIAMFHDVTITAGFLILAGVEFNLGTIAALLTVLGYSINDTIVIYDRIRENMARRGNADLEETMNISINETLTRTVWTVFTTLFTTIMLWIFGGGVLRDFAMALTVGIAVGAYSSIFVASPYVLFIDRWLKARLSAA